MIKLSSLIPEHLHDELKVPEEPGTTPIPPNFIRLYHYTNEPAQNLWRDGLLLSKAKGHTYGEPDFVWASTRKPENFKRYVEFAVPIDDKRFVRVFGSAPSKERGADFYNKHGAGGYDFTFGADISPDEFIAIHEPWHHTYRYLAADKDHIARTLNGEFDHLIGDKNHPSESKAVLAIKKNFGPKS